MSESVGLEAARKESTDKLFGIAVETRKLKVSDDDKFHKAFPGLDYNYSQVSTVLKERGFQVQWADNDMVNKCRMLEDKCKRYARILKDKDEQIESLEKDIKNMIGSKSESDKEIVWIGNSKMDGKSVYLSLPVSKEIASQWDELFGGLSCKQPLGNAVLGRFMNKVKNGEILIRM